MAKAMTAKQKEFQAHLEFMKAAERGRAEHSAGIEKDINTAFDSFIKLVEQHRQNLLQREESGKTTDLKQIWGQKEFIEVTLANIASGLRYVNRLCTCTNDQDMLVMSHEVKQQVLAIQRKSWAPEDSVQCSSIFSFCGTADGHQLATSFGDLKAVSPADFEVYISPLDHASSNSRCDIQLGAVVKVIVGIESTLPDTRIPHSVVTPSVSVIDNNTLQTLDYIHRLVYIQDSNSWMLMVAPTYSSIFTVTVSVRLDQGTCKTGSYIEHVARPQGGQLGRRVFREDMFEKQHGIGHHRSRKQTSKTAYTVTVIGAPKPGARVRRGPQWKGGSEDGGMGCEGIIMASGLDRESTSELVPASAYDRRGLRDRRGHKRPYMPGSVMVSVQWDNATSAQYEWAPHFPIELVPNYLFV